MISRSFDVMRPNQLIKDLIYPESSLSIFEQVFEFFEDPFLAEGGHDATFCWRGRLSANTSPAC